MVIDKISTEIYEKKHEKGKRFINIKTKLIIVIKL